MHTLFDLPLGPGTGPVGVRGLCVQTAQSGGDGMGRDGRAMNPSDVDARNTLLALINFELELISDRQHGLARRRALLREQATLLRLGAPPAVVLLTVKEASPPYAVDAGSA